MEVVTSRHRRETSFPFLVLREMLFGRWSVCGGATCCGSHSRFLNQRARVWHSSEKEGRRHDLQPRGRGYHASISTRQGNWEVLTRK